MSRTTQSRQKILQTASQLFLNNGYESTGVAHILKETGIGSGSLYWFFNSKEDLLIEVLEDWRLKLVQIIEKPAFEKSNSPLGRIAAILDFYRRHLLENHFALGCPIGNIVLELGDRYPLVRRKTEELFEDWRMMISKCLEPIADQLPPGITTDTLAMFVLTVMEGGIMQARAHKDIAYFDQSIGHLKNYLEIILDADRQSIADKGVSP